MGFKVRKLWLLPTRLFVLLVWGVLLAGSGLTSPALAASEIISAQPYPVGDLRITRDNLASDSYRLQIQNLNISAAETNRTRTQTWMLAGARGVMPQVEIESATFVHLRDGRQTTSTETPPEQIRQNIVRVADLGLFRQYWTYTFTITSASPAGEDSFWVLDTASIKIDIGKPSNPLDEATAARWTPEFGEEQLPGSLLINPDVPSDYYASDYGDPVETWSDWTRRMSMAAEADGLFRFSLFGGGLYRLSRSDVETSTGEQISTPATHWRVYRNGQEVAVISGLDEKANDIIYLPIAKSEMDGMQEQVYWLDTSGRNAKRQPPLRLTLPEVPNVPDEDSLTSTGAFTLVHREFNDYNPKLKAGPGADRWYWADLDADNPATLELTMPEYFQPAPGSTVRTSIRYGFTNFPPIQPALLVLAANSEAGQTSLTVQQGTATLDIPAELLKPGVNPIALRLDYPATADTKRPVTIQYIQTEWTQPLPAPGDNSVTFAAGATTTQTQGLAFSEPLSEDALVVGFQNDRATLISHTKESAVWQEQSYSLFQVTNRSAASPVPVLDDVQDVPNFSALTSAQSIIISADELASASRALVPMHEARGLSAQLYSTRMIYDAFSYGNPDPAAIRNFLRYLFYKAPGDIPEYVTLVGEASDFRGDPTIVPPSTQKDLLPASAAGSPDAAQGDQQYSAALGSDLVADFLVGRIPAATAKQVTEYVEKLRTFEPAQHGDWSRVTEFVMDDNDEFPDVVSRIVAGALGPQTDTRLFRQWDFEYVPNLRVPGKKRSWTATETLIDKFNEGIGVLNFFGHGGPNLWSHERLLHLSDLSEITNALRLPLITCASCDNAWISYPAPPVKASMGEQMVLKRDGGALALFGPVAGASPYEHSTLVQSLMEGVTRVQLRAVGDLILYAENEYYAITRSASIPDQYLLLGDPTVALPMPRVEPLLNGKVVETTDVVRAISVSLSNEIKLESTGTLRLVSSENQQDIATLQVNPGEPSWTVALPPDFPGGAVRAVLEWTAKGETQLAGATISVRPLPSPEAPEPVLISKEGAAYNITPAPAGVGNFPGNSNIYKFEINALIETTAPVRISAVRADGTKIAEVPRVEITTGTEGTSFDLNITVPLDPPATTVTLQVYPTDLSDQVDDPLTTATYLLPVEGTAELAFVPGTARAYSAEGGLETGETVFIEAKIQNTGAVAARNFTLQALRENPTTGTELQTINETSSYRLDTLRPGEAETVTFRWENSTRGTFEDIYLVANRNKVVRESDHEDNWILVPPFEVAPIGNYTVTDFTVTPPHAVPGTTVSVTGVAYVDHLHNSRPVTMELGWGRTFDGRTSSTRFPVEFVDDYATITRELVVPKNFAYAFLEVNADLEIEEGNSGDNTTQSQNMIAYPLDQPEGRALNLDDSLISGIAYNLDMPFDAVLRVSPDFTSVTELLVVDHQNITTGSASGANATDDNAWWVVPWRISAAPVEPVGEIGFRLPLDTVQPDVPGLLRAWFIADKGQNPTLDVKLGDGDWHLVTAGGGGPKPVADFGVTQTQGGALVWNMRPAGDQGVTVEYLRFYPHAVEWDSPPYLLPSSMRSQLLNFSVDTDLAKWKAFYIEWRAGSAMANGEIDWTPWQSVQGNSAPLSSEEYLQIRIIGVPLPGEKPQIENFRLRQE